MYMYIQKKGNKRKGNRLSIIKTKFSTTYINLNQRLLSRPNCCCVSEKYVTEPYSCNP